MGKYSKGEHEGERRRLRSNRSDPVFRLKLGPRPDGLGKRDGENALPLLLLDLNAIECARLTNKITRFNYKIQHLLKVKYLASLREDQGQEPAGAGK
jgi:hypothetical protein